MVSPLRWKRRLRVTVAGLIVESGKIAVDIRREASRTSLTGSIELFNLSVEHAARIFERRTPITVEGGYGDSLSTLAVARTQRVEKARDDLDRITRIHLDPITRSRPGVTTRSYTGAHTLRRIVSDLVTDFEEPLALGPLDAIPNVFVENWVFDGATTEALDSLLQPHGVDWYCDNDTLRFNRVGYVQPGAILIVNRNTGLVSSPTPTDDGATLTTLLEPRARVGGLLRLTSETLTGEYKTVKIQHIGSNYDGELLTHYDVRVHE